MKKAIILLSGGLDSATCLAIAREMEFEIYALSFLYGQKHAVEIDFAKKIAQSFGVLEHKIAKIDLGIFGGSALTADIEVPKDRDVSDKSIPITYVPARNLIFLSYALGYAEIVGAFDIFIGVNAVDYSGYPDCRPEFITRLATAVGLKNKFKVHMPLVDLTKQEIIAKGKARGVDYAMTHSCYDPIVKEGKVYACGRCDSCQIRADGFLKNAMTDPARQ
jgi:7-cyano-7-deazaguanine synthase